MRQRWVEQSLEQALGRKTQQRRKARLLDGEQEAQLVALACSELPKGQAKWSLRLLAERMMSLEDVETMHGLSSNGSIHQLSPDRVLVNVFTINRIQL